MVIHIVLLPSLHFLSSRSSSQQTKPELKVSQCQAHSLLSCSCLALEGGPPEEGKTPRYGCGSETARANTTIQNCDAPTQNSAWEGIELGSVKV